jgi:hypothetical protein
MTTEVKPMETGEIQNRAERMGSMGVDLRTSLLDIEDRLGRPMTFEEHQSWLTGWWLSEKKRTECEKRRDIAVALVAFGVQARRRHRSAG